MSVSTTSVSTTSAVTISASPAPASPALSALAAYRDLPAISGRSFLPISLLGRLPMAMTPVAILTFVAASTGDFAAAGIAATATAAGTAAGAPSMGLLADRFGQRLILGIAVLLNAGALIALALAGSTSPLIRIALCAAIGLSMPQVGGMARARWLALTTSRLNAAFAFEGTADELAFVLGPALAGILASLWGPGSALLTAAALGLTAAGAFAVHPTHAAAAAVTAVRPARTGTFTLLRALALPMAAMALMGVFFASMQTSMTAFSVAAGRPSAGGLLYALMAVGSALTASLMPVLPARFGPRIRCLTSAAGLLIGVLALSAGVMSGTVAVAAAILFTGLWVGPLLITVNGVAAGRVQVQQGAGAMAFLSAGLVCGIAAGALAAGSAAAAAGSRGALLVTGTSAAGLVVTALMVRSTSTGR